VVVGPSGKILGKNTTGCEDMLVADLKADDLSAVRDTKWVTFFPTGAVVIKNYIEKNDITGLTYVYQGLLGAYLDDISKYARNTTMEVKSGKTGTLRSLYQFMKRADHAFALRLYAAPIHRTKAPIPDGKTYDLLSLPYFLAGKLHDYLIWLINE